MQKDFDKKAVGKKRVLFISDSMACDGASRNLISLFSVFDYDLYDVQLLLLSSKDSIFYKRIPSNVRKLNEDEIMNAFFQPLFNSMALLLRGGHLIFFIYRIIFSLVIRLPFAFFQRFWLWLVKRFPDFPGDFDVVIGYQDILSGYYAAFKTSGKIKIGWNHHDYLDQKRDIVSDSAYIGQIDYLVTISKASLSSLKKALPKFSYKFRIIPNIIRSDVIKSMAVEGRGFDDSFEGIRILTIGRLCKDKGIDIALEACRMLLEDGYNVRWYVLGDGPMVKKLKKLTRRYSVESQFILLGESDNPFPYLAQSAIYVQPSRTEAFGNAVAEARILCKPIVVTDLPAFRCQLRNGIDGLIVQTTPKAVYEGVKKLIEEPRLLTILTQNLKSKNVIDENDLTNLYKLFQV